MIGIIDAARSIDDEMIDPIESQEDIKVEDVTAPETATDIPVTTDVTDDTTSTGIIEELHIDDELDDTVVQPEIQPEVSAEPTTDATYVNISNFKVGREPLRPGAETNHYYQFTTGGDAELAALRAAAIQDIRKNKNLTNDQFERYLANLEKYIQDLYELRNTIESAHVSAKRENANYANAIQVEDRNAALAPLYSSALSRSATDVEQYIASVRATILNKKPLTGFLYNSGIAIRIEPVSLDRVISFITSVLKENQDLGFNSGGVVYDGEMTAFMRNFIELAIEHISVWSIAVPKEDLVKHISVLDYDTLVDYMASAVWSNGFKLRLICMADPGNCNHTYEDTIHPRDAVFADINRLSKSQLKFYEQSMDKMRDLYRKQQSGKSIVADQISLSDVDAYKANFKSKVTTLFNEKNLRFGLKIPVLYDLIEQGKSWHQHCRSLLNISRIEGEDERTKVILRNSQATALRKFASYIESVEEVDENGDSVRNPLTKQDDIERFLNELSSDIINSDPMFTPLSEAISNLVSDAQVVVVGIREHACPACGGKVTHKIETATPNHFKRLEYIVPIPVDKIFFQLMRSICNYLTPE